MRAASVQPRALQAVHDLVQHRAAVGASLYTALMTAWIYGVVDPSLGYGREDLEAALTLPALGVLHVATGVVVARWWAPLLVGLPVALAVPAGLPEETYHDPWPIWFELVLFAPLGFVLAAAGVAAAKLHARRSA